MSKYVIPLYSTVSCWRSKACYCVGWHWLRNINVAIFNEMAVARVSRCRLKSCWRIEKMSISCETNDFRFWVRESFFHSKTYLVSGAHLIIDAKTWGYTSGGRTILAGTRRPKLILKLSIACRSCKALVQTELAHWFNVLCIVCTEHISTREQNWGLC